jgi:excisionase family DNA binding protein
MIIDMDKDDIEFLFTAYVHINIDILKKPFLSNNKNIKRLNEIEKKYGEERFNVAVESIVNTFKNKKEKTNVDTLLESKREFSNLVNTRGINMKDTQFLSTKKVADMTGLSLGTIQKMTDTGVFRYYTTLGGHRRILASSVHHYLKSRDLQLMKGDN